MAVQMRKSARLEDPGAELLDQVTGAWDRYGRITLIAIGVVAVVVLAAVMMLRARSGAEEQAAGKLMESDLMFWQGDYARSVQSARQTYQQYGQTPSGIDAHRIAGDAQFWQGNFADAVTEYRTYLDHTKTGPLADAVRRSLAYTLESQKDPRTNRPLTSAVQEARDLYLGLVGKFDRESSGEFLEAAARCDRTLGHSAEAIQDLQRLDKEFGETQAAQHGRMELAEIQAATGAVPQAH